MSYAWQQLQSAVRILSMPSDRRERLTAAYAKLLKLKPKDLPAEVVDDYCRLVGGISRYPAKSITREIKAEVQSLSDAEVMESIDLILSMHDALSVYQPRPIRPSGGMHARTGAVPGWFVPSMHGAETRKGAFESIPAR